MTAVGSTPTAAAPISTTTTIAALVTVAVTTKAITSATTTCHVVVSSTPAVASSGSELWTCWVLLVPLVYHVAPCHDSGV